MSSLVSVLAAILVLAVAQSGFGSSTEIPGALAVGFVLPYLLSFLAQRAALLGRNRRARAWITATEASGWLSYAVLSLGCGWLETVRRWTGAPLDLEAWPDFALALSFVPFVAYQVAAIDGSVRAHGGTRLTRRHVRAFQLRMFVACGAPIAVFVLASALLGTNEWLRAHVEHVGLFSALFTVLMITLLARILPALLRWSWDTVPFPSGPVRELLDRVADRAGFRPREIRLWRTGDLMANAAIVGFGERGRTVLFSDHLLSLLNSRELCSVYAHEIGHARRRHVGAFVAWMAAFVLLGDLAVRALIESGHEWTGAGVGAGAFALWYVSFGWLSRRYELDADLFSLDVLGDLPALVSALERVGGRLRDVAGWRHFSVSRRIRFLERASTDPPFVESFRRRLGRFGALGYGLAIVGALAQLVDLAADLPRDRAVASLARGRYVQALALAQGVEGDDGAELRELANAALALDGPGPGVAAEALDRSLRAGDADLALVLARIASLRGVPDARGVIYALEGAIDGDGPAVERAIEGLAPDWREAVRVSLDGDMGAQE